MTYMTMRAITATAAACMVPNLRLLWQFVVGQGDGLASLAFESSRPIAAGDASPNGLLGIFIFLLFVTPFYLFMRWLSKLARIRYGLDDGELEDGPPLRVCEKCYNSVLEMDWDHCPYCGQRLPALDSNRSPDDEAQV